MQTSTESLSTVFSLALSLVGSFEGFSAPPVAKSARWAIAKELVTTHGVKAPRATPEDLTVLGHLAILETLAAAETAGLTITGDVGAYAFVPGVASKAKVTVAQRIALVALFEGRITVASIPTQTCAALIRRGLLFAAGPNYIAFTAAGSAYAAMFQAAA